MHDVTTIDWKQDYTEIKTLEIAKQKVFFIQGGIDYDAAGKAINAKQVKDHYAAQAKDAQAIADEAKAAAAEAQATADEMIKNAKKK